MSERVRKAIPAYMQWKYEADKNLVNRTTFKWTILRPGGLTHEPGKGTASIGKTHITQTISVSHCLVSALRMADPARSHDSVAAGSRARTLPFLTAK